MGSAESSSGTIERGSVEDAEVVFADSSPDSSEEKPVETPVSEETTVAPTGEQSSEEEEPERVDEFEAAHRKALERLSAEPVEEPGADGEGDTPSAEGPGESTNEGEEDLPPEHPTRTPQQERDRIYEYWRTGRLSELTPDERGWLNRMEKDLTTRIEQQTQEEQEFKELYLSLLAQKEESPEEFLEVITDSTPMQDGRSKGRHMQDFFDAYAAAHPEVTLDNPDAPTLRRADVRQESITEAFSVIDRAIGVGNETLGLPEEVAVKAYEESDGTFQSYYVNLVKAGAEKIAEQQVEKQLAKIREEERAAAELQAQQKIVANAPASARRAASMSIGGSGTANSAPKDSWEAAANRARVRLESSN